MMKRSIRRSVEPLVGWWEGCLEGCEVGFSIGCLEGCDDGWRVGRLDG